MIFPKSKKGANWSLIIGGFVLFTMVMFAGGSFIGDMTNSYSINSNNQFDNTFNKFADISNVTGQMSQTLQTGTVEESDIFTTVSRNALASLKILFNMPSLIISIFSGISIAFGLPYWVLPIVVLSIILSIGFMILIAFLKTKPEDS